ncbi:MAG: molecular chaperone DnaJ [Planctomycetes bacterium]|nr:molecular chaperone DnaJ [Planctomycetota bacterium]
MSEERDYYEVLEVDRKANEDEIKKAYRKAAMKYHPDRNPGDKLAEERFKDAAEAYSVLSDPEKRARYDRFGRQAFGSGGGAGPTFTNVEDIFEAFGGSIFGDLFGGGRRRAGPQSGRDLRIELALSLEEIDTGVEKRVDLKRRELCAPCKGSGAQPGTEPLPCKQCGGRGQVYRNQGFFTMGLVCPACRGAGSTIASPCGACKGAGRTEAKVEIKIDVPAGVEDGMQLRVTGEGDAGDPGAPRGSLYCIVREKEHRMFQRDGADVMCKLPFSFTQLALGDEVEVPTLRGRARMTIPPGTASGKVFRLRGQGVPQIDGRGRGDQLVHVQVEVPTKLDARQKELLREFAELESKHSGDKSFFEKIASYFS